MPATLEATTEWLRSSGPEADRCRCCDGAHVFSYRLVELDPPGPYGPASFMDSAEDWLREQVREAPEGARLRISVEVVS